MEQNTTTREWLGWLIRVRLLTILLILAVDLIWPQYIPASSVNRHFFLSLAYLVTVGVLHISLVRWMPGAAGRIAGCQRRNHNLCPRHTTSLGKLFHLPLSAGHHRNVLFSRRVAFVTTGYVSPSLAG
jgi:hypothetical protein